MSLIPPSSFVTSKMKYYLKSHLDQELYERVLEQISPLSIFKVSATLRLLDGKNTVTDLDEKQVEEILGEPHVTDDVDKVMFFYKRVQDRLKAGQTQHVCIRTAISARLEKDGEPWHDCLVDEFFVNADEKVSSDK